MLVGAYGGQGQVGGGTMYPNQQMSRPVIFQPQPQNGSQNTVSQQQPMHPSMVSVSQSSQHTPNSNCQTPSIASLQMV